jgi:hypothetical protein
MRLLERYAHVIPFFKLILGLIFSLLAFVPDIELLQQKALFVTLLMAFYWITESLPLPITALVRHSRA